MSPAEVLRAAASKVRATAKKAAPWPWNLDGPWWWDVAGGTAEATTVISTPARDAVVVVPPPRGQVPADGRAEGSAAWIALMSPALAELLAAWLEATADEIDRLAGDLTEAELAKYDPMTPTWMPALAVARHVLDTFPLPPSS
ncbi:hypothetical protein AB0F88_39780 [Streptosporangium sp. NPDC023963]|uniref:hypothetical protein n=1 Tax=Streptosporangium sp. NPDC023963 TaxID=3155608 RepID=UPI0034239CD1